jgi:uncharacterized protein (TIGR02646 family)
MRSLLTPTATATLQQLHREYPSGPWNLLDPDASREQRELLILNQSNVCAWCESKIELNVSHSDHILSRSRFPQFTFSIGNLVAACQCSETCGHGRQGKGDLPVWIHPYDTANLEHHFEFDPDGGIRPALKETDPRTPEAAHAINLQLNLNQRTLKERREAQMAMINSYVGQDLTPDDIASFFTSFPTLTRQLLS